MTENRSSLVATLGLLLACWPAWWFAGWLVETAGLGAIDLLVRVCLVFLALGIVGEAVDRWLGAGDHSG